MSSLDDPLDYPFPLPFGDCDRSEKHSQIRLPALYVPRVPIRLARTSHTVNTPTAEQEHVLSCVPASPDDLGQREV